MLRIRRSIFCTTIVATFLLIASAVGASVNAQSIQKAPTAKAKAEVDPAARAAASQKSLQDGLAALEAGKNDPAAKQLSAAITGGGLNSQQMAKALYARGIAYRRLNKQIQAVTDLTNALALKNGLTEAERADAIENRVQARREAGLPEEAPTPKITAVPTEPKAAETPPPPATGGFFSNLFSVFSSPPPVIIKSTPSATTAPPPVATTPPPTAVPETPTAVPEPPPAEKPPVSGWAEGTKVTVTP